MHCEHRLTMVLCIAREYSEGDILFSTMKHSSVTRSEGQEMTRGDRKFSVWAHTYAHRGCCAMPTPELQVRAMTWQAAVQAWSSCSGWWVEPDFCDIRVGDREIGTLESFLETC